MALHTAQVVASVTTTSAVALAANPHRRHMLAANTGTETAYLSLGQAAAVGAGMPIVAGAIPIEIDADRMGDGVGLPMYAIVATGTTMLVFWVSQD